MVGPIIFIVCLLFIVIFKLIIFCFLRQGTIKRLPGMFRDIKVSASA